MPSLAPTTTIENTHSEPTNCCLSPTSQGTSTHKSPHILSIHSTFIFSFNGWGVSIVDSIDTMILMNLTLQYDEAKQHVSTIDFTHGSDTFVPFFEAIIRYLGGLLSAYSLTKEPIFLTKADDIGRALLPIFNTTSGIPAFAIKPETKVLKTQGWTGGTTLLSEMVSSSTSWFCFSRERISTNSC